MGSTSKRHYLRIFAAVLILLPLGHLMYEFFLFGTLEDLDIPQEVHYTKRGEVRQRVKTNYTREVRYRKRGQNRQRVETNDTSQWILRDTGWKENVRLQTPVFLLSMPKSATTSLWRYFNCGNSRRAVHHATLFNETTNKEGLIGKCMAANERSNRPLVQGCYWSDRIDVFTDVSAHWGWAGGPAGGRTFAEYISGRGCFIPLTLSVLKNIERYYPNATIMQSIRDPQDWYRSFSSWRLGGLVRMFGDISCPEAPNASIVGLDVTTRAWIDFYQNSVELVRNFTRNHPTLKYVEVEMGSPSAPYDLEKEFGIPAMCYRNCLPELKGKCTSVVQPEQLIKPQENPKETSGILDLNRSSSVEAHHAEPDTGGKE